MNPLLFDFPSEFYTERLCIRMPKPGDGKVVYDAIQASMQELKPWMVFAQKEQTEEEVEVSIRKSHIQFLQREDLRLLVFRKKQVSLLHQLDCIVLIGIYLNLKSGIGLIQGLVDRAIW